MTKKSATLAEIKNWPATINVTDAARGLGVSSAHAYQCIKDGVFPIRIIRIGKRTRVLTASLVHFLETGESDVKEHR